MQGYNYIMVYNQQGSKLLFCKRTKTPYQGLYNLVGGKIESDEDGFYLLQPRVLCGGIYWISEIKY